MPIGVYHRPNACTLTTANCLTCHQAFTFKQYRDKQPKRFCNKNCHLKFQRERRRKVPMDRELLHRLYWEDGKTTVEIASIFNTNHSVVKWRMKQLSIPRRPAGSIKGKPHVNRRPKLKAKRTYGYAEDRAWRNAVLERDDYTCQMCRKRGGELNADHIKPHSLFPELRNDINNGRTLCVPCHRNTETYGGKIRAYKKKIEQAILN